MVKDYIHDPVKLAVVRKDMEFILMTAVCCHVRKVQISTNSKSDAPKTWTLPDKQNHRSCEHAISSFRSTYHKPFYNIILNIFCFVKDTPGKFFCQ